jgi:hypothetical protein
VSSIIKFANQAGGQYSLLAKISNPGGPDPNKFKSLSKPKDDPYEQQRKEMAEAQTQATGLRVMLPTPGATPGTTGAPVARNFTIKKATTPVAATPAPAPGGKEMCTACGKTVYPAERIVANDGPYHKACLRCAKCNTALR